jgi:hypothetical protein
VRSDREGRPIQLKRCIAAATAAIGMVLSQAASGAENASAGGRAPALNRASQEQPHMWMTFGTHRFAVTLEDSPTARAFVALLPVTLEMPDLNGNEKHVRLPRPLPTAAVRPGTISAGDVMLYGSDTLVVFYETFISSYSYTRIGRIPESAGLAKALGPDSQRITFTVP